MSETRLAEIQARLGYRFETLSLLEKALRHESFINESEESVESNERLEFLGDSVLGLVVAEFLYRTFGEHPEGDLARMKSYLVSTSHLAEHASRLELGQFLILGKGELLSHGRKRRSLLADVFEAVIGAIYLDGGLEPARDFIVRILGPAMEAGSGLKKDYKSVLQEWTQSLYKELPDYRVIKEEGPPHERVFEVEVTFRGQVLGVGRGQSKREASQQAAKEALEKAQNEGNS